MKGSRDADLVEYENETKGLKTEREKLLIGQLES